MEVLLLLRVFAISVEPMDLGHALLELVPEHVHHSLLDFIVHLVVFEERNAGEDLGEGLETRPKHDDYLNYVHLRLVAQIEEDDH